MPMVPTRGFTASELATMRCDYLLASQALAARAKSYQVILGDITDQASDHYELLATFELGEDQSFDPHHRPTEEPDHAEDR